MGNLFSAHKMLTRKVQAITEIIATPKFPKKKKEILISLKNIYSILYIKDITIDALFSNF